MSIAPTAAELAAMTAACTALLPDTATIQRVALTTDGMGGQKASSTSTVATVPCRVSQWRDAAKEQQAAGERVSSTVEWVITFPAATDVRPSDLILVGSRTFQVSGLLAGSYEVQRRAICQEANP